MFLTFAQPVLHVPKVKHLQAAEGHQHPATGEIASFLKNIKEIQQDPETMVYITAVGGEPFANYIQGFPLRAHANYQPKVLKVSFDGLGIMQDLVSLVEDFPARICTTCSESWAFCTGHCLHGFHCLGSMLAGVGILFYLFLLFVCVCKKNIFSLRPSLAFWNHVLSVLSRCASTFPRWCRM